MRLLDGFSRAGAVRLTGVLLAAIAVAACCIGVSSAASESVIRTIHVGKEPFAVSSDGTHVWVTNSLQFAPGESTVSEIEASSGTVIRTIHIGGWLDGVSSDGTHVWVTNPPTIRSVRSKRPAAPSSARPTSPTPPGACLRMEPTSGSRTRSPWRQPGRQATPTARRTQTTSPASPKPHHHRDRNPLRDTHRDKEQSGCIRMLP